MFHKRAALLLLCAGCAPERTPVEDSGAPPAATCPASLVAIAPAADAREVSPVAAIEARVEGEPDEEPEIHVVGPDGEVEGASAWDPVEGRATFVPAVRLDPGGAYTASVQLCDEPATWGFTVRTAIGPEIEGAGFDLDLATVTWVSPDAILGSIFLGYLLTDHVLLVVQDVDPSGDTLDLAGAMGWMQEESVVQYPCADSLDFPSVAVPDNPAFTTSPYSARLISDGAQLDLQDMVISGSFDGTTRLVDVRLSVAIDIGDLYFGGDPLCDVVADYGYACVACPEGGEERCLYLEATSEEAPATSVPVDPDLDPSADPDCRLR